MNLRGTLNLCFFYSAWMGGSALFPVAAVCLFYGIYFPTYFIIAYYSFRFIFPAKHWDFVRETLCGDNNPYTRSSRIVFEDGAKPPKPDSRTLISVAPHGILTLGWSYLISSNAFSTCATKWLVAPAMMHLPLVSDIMHWTSCFSCDGANMRRIMKTGCNVGLIPGGFQEATLYTRGLHRVYWKDRKGFIKYALQNGYQIQPCYAFGEELTFWTVDLLPKSIALWLNTFNIPTCFFIGKFLFMPDNEIDFTVVVGKPLQLSKNNKPVEQPSKEEVDRCHKLFMEAYQALFEKYKGNYAAEGEKAVLEIS